MTMTATTGHDQESTEQPTLFLAFELGVTTWKLACTIGPAQRPRERSVPARDIAAVREEIVRAKQRFGVREAARVVSCYQAGRDSFWLRRALGAQGVANVVVESASLEVKRHYRRAKTARLDVYKLLTVLMRHAAGERKAWSVVHVPSVDEEDRRQLHREMLTAKRDRTRVIDRIKGLLASQGLTTPLHGDFLQQLEHLRLWDDAPVPPGRRHRLFREGEQLAGLSHQVAQLGAARQERLRSAADTAMAQVRQLLTLQGIGVSSAWVLVTEFFGWRAFRSGKEVGALSGLTPAPHASATITYEWGIAKAGNRHIRALAIEMAWGWQRFQPESALARWHQARFGQGSSPMRRVGIVALARKLLIVLWRFLETGALPAGAALKTTVRLWDQGSFTPSP
jgi:transposase